MSFAQFLSPLSWLSTSIPNVEGAGRFIFVFCAALVIAGLVVRIRASKERKARKHLFQTLAQTAALLLTMGILGCFLFFFSYENIRFFGARFWYPAWILAAIVWAVLIAVSARKRVPRALQAEEERAAIAKYLPKSKKR